MTQLAPTYEIIAAALAPHGLTARGGFSLRDGVDQPLKWNGTAISSVVLAGHAGSSIWPHFQAWRDDHPGQTDPLDAWSSDVLRRVATELGAQAAFPSDRPWLPFQQWAMRAEKLDPSPLGLLMHPKYGLWHAYRGALLFHSELQLPDPVAGRHPCHDCQGKPCLSACPVNAFYEGGYDVGACRSHLATPAGRNCMEAGCKARNACPVGVEYAYTSAQMRFHMDTFATG
ncbi:MAG: hypothetical protein ACRECW_00755 [Phyllobacterium sp.]